MEGAEPTNNGSERTLGSAVLWRTGSFGCESEAGSRFVERLLIVVATCRQQGRPLLEFLVAGETALRRSPPPSRLWQARGLKAYLNGYSTRTAETM